MTLGIFNDARYHGGGRRRPFFEGWYFKHAGADGSFAVIPGVYLGADDKDDHAFIQILFSSPPESRFIRFPINAFACASRGFEVRIGDNIFSLDGCRLNIPDIGLAASLEYACHVPLITNLFSPTIMGPFAYVPGMQCRHGVLSLWHRASGCVQYGGRRYLFDRADGYIEKDWGGAFPDSWVWMQCGGSGLTLMCAIASIPLKLTRFIGVIGVLRDGDRQYRFATYNGARVARLEWRSGCLSAELAHRDFKLSIKAMSGTFGHLLAPTPTGMDRKIQESLDARFSVSMEHRGGAVLQGRYTGGLEMLGIQRLIKCPGV